GPRVVAASGSAAQSSSARVLPPPVVIPTSGSSAVAVPPLPEAGPELVPLPGEIAEIHAGREKASSHFSQQQREGGHPIVEGDALQQIPLELIDENPYQTRRTFDEAALN